ncbi:MAG: hypothetical protein Aurels2KO_00520 [Aureliella sp.]
MSKATISAPLTATDAKCLSDAPDSELLQIYAKTGNNAAAEVLIHRYAPIVATVCKSTVSDHQSAEDAF